VDLRLLPMMVLFVSNDYGLITKINTITRGYKSLCLLQLHDGNLVSGNNNGSIEIWDSQYKCVKTLLGHEDAVICLALFDDGNIISGSVDTSITIWDPMKDSGWIQILEGHSKDVERIVILPNDEVASGSLDNSLIIWGI
jgi:F-box/WD-40 domain protein 7